MKDNNNTQRKNTACNNHQLMDSQHTNDQIEEPNRNIDEQKQQQYIKSITKSAPDIKCKIQVRLEQ